MEDQKGRDRAIPRRLRTGLPARLGTAAAAAVIIVTSVAMNSGFSMAAAGRLVSARVLAFGPPCLFHQITGLHCPGCGATRALRHLLQGEPLAALGSNALVVAVVPLLFVLVLYSGVPGASRTRLRGLVSHSATGWTLAVVTILFAVLRNLPLAPFRWLAP